MSASRQRSVVTRGVICGAMLGSILGLVFSIDSRFQVLLKMREDPVV